MKRILDFFTSVKLTLATLLGLAAVAVGGTIWPVEQGMIQRFELYYQSWWFRVLLGVLAINLAACTWRTFSRVVGETARLLKSLESPPAGLVDKGMMLPVFDLDEVTLRLQEQGYRTTRREQVVLARKGVSGRWSLPILHLAILAVMLGALASQLGFVGTINMYVTHTVDQYFDWDAQAQKPLGFSMRLDHFEPRYYPIDLRFATFDKQTRQQLQEFTTSEGETVAISPEFSVQVQRFYPEEEHLVLGILRNGILIGEYHSLSGTRTYPNSIDPGVVIKPTAFRDPTLKQLHSRVTILENGREVRQGIIEVNTPLVHQGVAIYQTAYSRDESGFWTCGFQVSKDPGEAVVWIGCVILSVALFLVFWVRYRAVGVRAEENGLRIIPLTGFRGEKGQDHFTALLSALKTRVTEDR